ncbi:MAG: glycosyltransferase, partial [Polyangiaceae bacterium]
QLRALATMDELEVIALIPWLPAGRLFGRASTAEIPARDRIDGLAVSHPRVLYGPGPARPLSGALVAASLLPRVWRLRGAVDVVLGCFAYPDGWAATALARALGVPAVVKVHGSDVNLLGDDPLLRSSIRTTMSRTAAVVGPSQELVDRAIALGADPETSTMIPNGTDASLFHPRDREACRTALGHGADARPWILFVGRLSVRKGAVDLLEAFADVHRRHPEAQLVLVGGGDDERRLRDRVEREGLPVRFTGFLRPDEIPVWMGASDVVTLPSHAEGTPNVVLEALASGRRVVASAVGGIPAVLTDAQLGELVPARAPQTLADALCRSLERDDDPKRIAAAAPLVSWTESATRLHDVLRRAASGGSGRRGDVASRAIAPPC